MQVKNTPNYFSTPIIFNRFRLNWYKEYKTKHFDFYHLKNPWWCFHLDSPWGEFNLYYNEVKNTKHKLLIKSLINPNTMYGSCQLVYNIKKQKLIRADHASYKQVKTSCLMYNRKQLEKLYGKLTLKNNPLGFFYGEICSKDKYWYNAPWGIYMPIMNKKAAENMHILNTTKQLMELGIVVPFDDKQHTIDKTKISYLIKNKVRLSIRRSGHSIIKLSEAI